MFDSLGGKHSHTAQKIRNYLVREAEAKKGVKIENPSKAIKYKSAEPPTQDNWCDCGVFLLHYVEIFLQDPEKYLQLIFRKRTEESSWFDKTDVGRKRAEILKLMEEWAERYAALKKGKGKA
ncbi:hypothetical protein HDV00_011072 [Rhizophlyctis rosea]|nr:hypothetical protein HDV00_011072 [Rhizophlyctis rosea]